MQNLTLYRNKSLVALVICLGLSLGMMFTNVQFKALSIRNVLFVVTYPIQYSISAVGHFFQSMVTGFSTIRQLEKTIAENEEQLVKYRENLLLYSQVMEENQALRLALEMKERVPHTTKYARVVYRDPNLTSDMMILDRGSLDGIRPDMPVVSYNQEGTVFLVGRTVDVSFSASKVKLITSADSFIGVTLRTSGYVGVLKGFGSWNQNCVAEYIPIEANAYIGEEVMTTGESDIFPPNLLVGKIVGIGKNNPEDFFKKLYVKPVYNYAKVRGVYIIDWKPGMEVNQLIQKAAGER